MTKIMDNMAGGNENDSTIKSKTKIIKPNLCVTIQMPIFS